MRIKTPMSRSELRDVAIAVSRFRECARVQNEIAQDVAEWLGCHVDEAVDLLNGYDDPLATIYRSGVEITGDDPDIIPIHGLTEHPADWQQWVVPAAITLATVCVLILFWVESY